MEIIYRDMRNSDYEAVHLLWDRTDGICVSDADSYEGISRYLDRNPGFSAVAEEEEIIVGAILCGHDGRRAHINHLVVADSHRRRGIAKSLVDHCLQRLSTAGVKLVYLSVMENNSIAANFWYKLGWNNYSEIFPRVQLLCQKI